MARVKANDTETEVEISGPDAGPPLVIIQGYASQMTSWPEEYHQALAAAGMDATNIVRLNMYTTDVPTFMASAHDIVSIFAGDGCQPVSTLLGVTALFEPEIMIELEATAVA